MPQLYVITDASIQNRFSHLELAEMALRGGADLIQLRDKKMKTRELLETAIAMRALCKKAGIPFLVNDRVDIALMADADGVHLGEEDFPVPPARKILGPGKIIGGTAANLDQALALEKQGASYIGFGPIFPTSTKLKSALPKGVAELERVCRKTKIPVFAIGGIRLSNVSSLLKTGVAGVAVIHAICGAENPEAAARMFKEILIPIELDPHASPTSPHHRRF